MVAENTAVSASAEVIYGGIYWKLGKWKHQNQAQALQENCQLRRSPTKTVHASSGAGLLRGQRRVKLSLLKLIGFPQSNDV